jgi:competence ComEA-like helix-hairpin-helix protein
MHPLLLIPAIWAGTLQVDVLDVGQGDAILVQSPRGKTVLIDGGDRGSHVATMLAERGIHTLDMVVATHAHADHIGGLAEVFATIEVKSFLDAGLPHSTQTYAQLMAAVEAEPDLVYRTARQGRVFKMDDGIELSVLLPAETLFQGTRSDLNANSVVLRLDHKDICMLFMGDAEHETERALLRTELQPCEVLKVAHHGSGYASTSTFLQRVDPDIAIISVGQRNRYDHPDESTLTRLAQIEATIHRTDIDGTLHLESNGRKVTVTAHKELARAARRAQAVVSRAEGYAQVDVNKASIAELDTLPGIGPAKAQAILLHREAHGPFTDLSQLDDVPGIGPGTLAKLQGRVRFDTLEPVE